MSCGISSNTGIKLCTKFVQRNARKYCLKSLFKYKAIYLKVSVHMYARFENEIATGHLITTLSDEKGKMRMI